MAPPKNLKSKNLKVAEGLKAKNSRIPKFYLRPEIHKRGNLGRPVVSSVKVLRLSFTTYS